MATNVYQVDPHSPTAWALRDWAKSEIERNQRALETIDLPPTTTEGHRHAIQQLRGLLKLVEPSTIASQHDVSPPP